MHLEDSKNVTPLAIGNLVDQPVPYQLVEERVIAATVDVHPAHHVAASYIDKAVGGGSELCISPQVCREFLVVLTRQASRRFQTSLIHTTVGIWQRPYKRWRATTFSATRGVLMRLSASASFWHRQPPGRRRQTKHAERLSEVCSKDERPPQQLRDEPTQQEEWQRDANEAESGHGLVRVERGSRFSRRSRAPVVSHCSAECGGRPHACDSMGPG